MAREFPEKCREDREMSSDYYKAVIYHIGFYVSKLYGKKTVQRWVNKNKGCSLLRMVTTSDIAYSHALIENSRNVWEQKIAISKLPEDVRRNYKASNRKKLPAEEQEDYANVPPKFTGRKGRKAGYLSHGWSDEGIAFYKER